MRRSLVLAVIAALVTSALALVATPTPATAAECTPLDLSGLTFDAPHLTGEVPSGSDGVCYALAAPDGTTIQVGSLLPNTELSIVDHTGAEICRRHGTCALTNGPFELRVTSSSAPQPYELQVFRVGEGATCPSLALAQFGNPGASAAQGELAPREADCRGLELEVGNYLLQNRGDGTLLGPDGTTTCHSSSRPCRIEQTGLHFLLNVGSGDLWDPPATYASAVYGLDVGSGCNTPISMMWGGDPSSHIEVTSPVQVDCHRFDGRSGQRIVAEGSVDYDGIRTLTVDLDGEPVCEGESSNDLGCVVQRSGETRLLTWPALERDPADAYDLKARDVSTAAGCPLISPLAYGDVPTDEHLGIGCRQFDVSAGDIMSVSPLPTDGSLYDYHNVLYAPTGYQVCGGTPRCSFDTPGLATIFVGLFEPDFVTSLHDLKSTIGCTAQAADMVPRSGVLRRGEIHCTLLAPGAGSDLIAAAPVDQAAHIEVVNGAGVGQRCFLHADEPVDMCRLTGTGPFHAVISSTAETDYAVAFTTAGSAACAPLRNGSFDDQNTGAIVELGPQSFGKCFTVNGSERDPAEFLALDATAGTGPTHVAAFHNPYYEDVLYEDACNRFDRAPVGISICTPRPVSASYPVVLVNDASAATYRLRRHGASTAPGCASAASTSLGGQSTPVSVDARGDLECVRVNAAATDELWFDVRDQADVAEIAVVDSSGAVVCQFTNRPCLATGSAGYRVVVGSNVPTDAAIDTWRVRSAQGYAPECVSYDDYSTGFGPTTASLSEATPALCVLLRNGGNDRYEVTTRNTSDGSLGPRPVQVHGTGQYPVSCWGSGPWTCSSFTQLGSNAGIVLIGLADGQDAMPIEVTGTCISSVPCGQTRLSVDSMAPASAPANSSTTIVISGRGFQETDVVRLDHPFELTISGQTVSVSPDGTKLTARFDLRDVAQGAWQLRVGGTKFPLSFLVTTPAMRAATRPSIIGTARVDNILKASPGTWTATPTSYAYRWYANGAPISGATASSYKLTAKYLGKSITVAVTAKRSGWLPGTSTSAGKKVALGAAPVVVKKPTVTGTRRAGSRVAATKGTWSKAPSSYAYQWYVAGRKVAGATRPSLLLTKGMRGKQVKVVVTARRTGCANGTASSQPFTVR